MRGAGWLIRLQLRRGWLQLLPLFLVVALGGSGALVALGAADRTDHAFGDYVARARVSDAVINPSIDSADVRRVIGDLPGVRSVTSDGLFLASAPDDGHARPFREVNESTDGAASAELRGSSDGRYARADVPAVREGRLPTGEHEAFIGTGFEQQFHLTIGDTVPVAFWSPVDELIGDPDRVVSPIGVERVKIVGIGTFPDDVLPDRLYPHARAIVSPDVAAKYECRPQAPAPDASLEEALTALKPRDCAVSYQYYGIDVAGGDSAVDATLGAFVRRAEQLNERLPQSVLEQDARYVLISTRLSGDRDRIERATRPTVLALGVLGLVAGAITVVVGGLVVARNLRRAERDQREWWRLGLSRIARVAVVAVPAALAALAGLVVAFGGAWLLSTVGPVGTVRDVDPSPGRTLTAWPLLGAALLAVAMLALVGGLAFRWAHRLQPAPARMSPLVARLTTRFRRAETAEGVRAVYGGRFGSGIVVASGVVACSVFLAAVVFGASLSSLVSTPSSYGWPWQAAAVTNYGYGGLDVAAASAGLNRDGDVAQWSGLGFTPVTVDGEPIPTVMAEDGESSTDFAVVEGRVPRGAREVALGSRTASARGLSVGDTVRVSGDGVRPHRAKVSGVVVLPSLGPFQSERLAPGEGMLMPAAGFRRQFVQNTIAFLGVDFVDGRAVRPAVADLTKQVERWDPTGSPLFVFSAPVRPAEIDDAASMRTIPLLVGALLVVTSVIGLAIAVVLSVRSRRHELAVLRALGFTSAQVRRSVRVQSLAAVLPAVVVGIPLGVIFGRFLWRAFADELGVVTSISIPVVWVVSTAVGALVLALITSELPARIAARAHTAVALRTE